MLRSLTFALAVALVAASPMGPAGGNDFSPFADEHRPLSGNAQEELMKMAREIVGEGEAECDNEQEVYKWYPPLPCRVENSTYDTLAQRMCPEDGQCNVGPVDTTLNQSSVRIFFCSRPGKYMLYQACRIQNAQTGEEREASQCASYDGKPVGCTVGPFSVLSNQTNYIAYYCDTTMMDSIHKVAARGVVTQACRVENEYGDDQLRRMCPPGYRCNQGPVEGSLNNKTINAYLCKEEEMEFEWTLSETVHYLVIEKQVDPFVILMVMRNLQDHNIEIKPKIVFDLVMEQVKARMEEMAKEREEQEKRDPKENVEDIMHMLEHRRLLNMQAELRRKMFEEKSMEKGESAQDLMHMLHHVSLVAMEAKLTGKREDEGSMADLVKGMMGMKEEQDDDKGLADLLKGILGGKQEEMSQEAKLKMTLKKASFVHDIVQKFMQIEKMEGDDKAKMMMMMKAVHELLAENEEIMPEVSGEIKVVKVMKAVMYAKNNFEGAEKEQDEDVKWMLVIAKHILTEMKEDSADEEERQLKQLLGMLKEKKEEQEDDNPLMQLMKMMKEKKEEREDENPLKELMEMMMEKKEDREEKDPMKMILAMLMGKKEEREDENPLKELMEMMMEKKEDREDKDPMKMLLAMLMGKKEERDEKDPMKMILAMLMGKKGEREDENPLKELMEMMMEKKEEREEKDPMKMLLAMLMGKKGDDDEEENKKKMLLAMLMGKKGDDDEEEYKKKMLMALLMGGEMPEERESGDVLKEILSSLKELMEKNNGADNEAAQVLAFVKAMMGGEGDLQDVMHFLHHAHMIKTEAELRERHEQMAKQRDNEGKAQELLQYLHATLQQRQMGGFGLPPMAGRW